MDFNPPSLESLCISQWKIVKLLMHRFTTLPWIFPFLVMSFIKHEVANMMRRDYAFPVSWIKLMLMALRTHVGFRQTPSSTDVISMETICRWNLGQPLQASGAHSCWVARYDIPGEERETSYPVKPEQLPRCSSHLQGSQSSHHRSRHLFSE